MKDDPQTPKKKYNLRNRKNVKKPETKTKQLMEQDYSGANMTLSQISPSLYLDDSQESWEVNGVIYLTFESALSALIALVTQQYDSGGYISNT